MMNIAFFLRWFGHIAFFLRWFGQIAFFLRWFGHIAFFLQGFGQIAFFWQMFRIFVSRNSYFFRSFDANNSQKKYDFFQNRKKNAIFFKIAFFLRSFFPIAFSSHFFGGACVSYAIFFHFHEASQSVQHRSHFSQTTPDIQTPFRAFRPQAMVQTQSVLQHIQRYALTGFEVGKCIFCR